MKKNRITQVLTFVLVVILVFFLNCKRTTNTEAIRGNDSATVISIEKGLFIGLLGNDSVFIKSDIIERDLNSNLVLYLGNDVLYKDVDRDFYLISLANVQIIQLKNQKIAYILITKDDTPFDDKWFILRVYNRQVKGTYTVLIDILKDIDNDGFFEVGGIPSLEAACLDCDSVYYQPYRIYKLNETFEFDTILSKKYTIDAYGTFLGFDNYGDTVVQIK